MLEVSSRVQGKDVRIVLARSTSMPPEMRAPPLPSGLSEPGSVKMGALWWCMVPMRKGAPTLTVRVSPGRKPTELCWSLKSSGQTCRPFCRYRP